ncbi:MAG: ATP-binding cassette domain-containing protein [Nitrososphaerales archaeon]
MPDVINVDKLVEVYSDGTKAVDGVSFDVREGEFFGFLGPNSAGKSTTIKVLTTLLRKTSGKVTVARARTRSAETVFGIGGFLTFPLLFMSTALVPASAMPDWMASVSKVNPISFAVNAVRDLSLPNSLVAGDIVSAFIVISALAIVTLGATLYLFRKVVK